MQFDSPLAGARLIRRYKRFLADVTLDDGREVTAHCANPGAMTGLAEPGMRIWLEPNDNPRRSLRYSWKLAELPGGHLAGIDTAVPNRVVGEALRARAIPALAGYGAVRAEVGYGERSRVDFLLSEPGLPDCYVEVKNAHLSRQPGLAEFPDSVTSRGARHLDELAAVARGGARAVILYLVQRSDCDRMALASDIDAGYGAAAARAAEAGVETMAFAARLTLGGITLGAALPVGLRG